MSGTILVFGAGDNQVELIKACKQLGYRTLVTDPDKDAPGKQWADLFIQLHPNDLKAHINLIKKEKVKGIVSCQMENPLRLMSKLAQKFKFSFPAPEAIHRARNKYLMKKAFINGEVPCAVGTLFRNYEQTSKTDPNGWDFPLMIKPVDSYSSRGVFKVQNREQLVNLMPIAARYASTGEVLVETFLEGPEVSVESITYNGQTTIVQITDKIITPYPHTVELGHSQPSCLPLETLNDIKSIVKKAITAVGIDHCGSHAEVKITAQGPKMIEIAARLGGDYISSYLTKLSTGVDMNKAIAQVAMGEKPDLNIRHRCFSAIQYVNWEPGKKVDKILPLEPFMKRPAVVHAGILVREGDILPAIKESKNRHAFFITLGKTKEQLEKNIKWLTEEMRALVHCH